MKSRIKRVALSTGGGDAPGLNAVINAATLAARNRDWDVIGMRDGFNGLLSPEDYPDGGLIELTRDRVRGIIHKGGTIIGTIIGVLILRTMRNGIVLIGVPGLAYNIFIGGIILAMMALHSWLERRHHAGT